MFTKIVYYLITHNSQSQTNIDGWGFNNDDDDINNAIILEEPNDTLIILIYNKETCCIYDVRYI